MNMNKPLLFKGYSNGWPALHHWSWEYFADLKETMIDLYDHHGDFVCKNLLSEFVRQIDSTKLYASGWRFYLEHPEMKSHFSEPEFSRHDCLKKIPATCFLELLWIFIGGRGTGTSLHQDVLGSHAWLSIIDGKKLMALHPPEDFSTCMEEKIIESECVLESGFGKGHWQFFELNPGDLIFIPSLWWHAARNECKTIALTRNFVSEDIKQKATEHLYGNKLNHLVSYLE